jgi:hypothetical protein
MFIAHSRSDLTHIVCVCVLLFMDTKRPFGYVGVLQEEDVSPSDGQRDVLNQLRDWDLWCVAHT